LGKSGSIRFCPEVTSNIWSSNNISACTFCRIIGISGSVFNISVNNVIEIVVENNVVTYDVVVTKGTTQETLCYDSAGKFLKKMEAKSGMAKPGPKPTTKPPTKNK